MLYKNPMDEEIDYEAKAREVLKPFRDIAKLVPAEGSDQPKTFTELILLHDAANKPFIDLEARIVEALIWVARKTAIRITGPQTHTTPSDTTI